MPPEETNTPEPSPVVEGPEPAVEPVTPPEAPHAPTEAVPAPDSTHSISSPQAETAQSPTPTAQTAPNEPMSPEPELLDSASTSAEATTDTRNTPTPEPPSAAAPVPTSRIRDLLTRARLAIQDRKRKKRDKIMTLLNTKSKIANDEVEKLLHASDATATRYLSALEKEGRIRQVGKTGHGVVYQKF